MKCVFVSILVLLSVFSVDSQASLSFGNATPNTPGVSLTAVNRNGQLVVTVLWAFQASQCEILQRTDETVNSRARIVSVTSTCIHRNICQGRGPITTGITCEEFMSKLN
ncbi:hypothetical protein CRE_24754 [Caenorhabditis remanei]|uniref:Uncharacterized protein n=1 Tax=Caenorhabditis remanei TaxID=31234 RepID=E3N957_CAERE|nr:hypothetical protein CRE_24754 [Caenorhabditis remanei]